MVVPQAGVLVSVCREREVSRIALALQSPAPLFIFEGVHPLPPLYPPLALSRLLYSSYASVSIVINALACVR